ncbi:hypothetical protein NDU88_002515 [Pleurodeles waltl]|uniref:Uncharacterized protein n=1 Tax=Pleurodeles waltl TaxID=8319 RepID=A0AAV7WNS6_PLEWA|nr:hypothetical protein NDU88_002515 [Pleurodeles waltl]
MEGHRTTAPSSLCGRKPRLLLFFHAWRRISLDLPPAARDPLTGDGGVQDHSPQVSLRQEAVVAAVLSHLEAHKFGFATRCAGRADRGRRGTGSQPPGLFAANNDEFFTDCSNVFPFNLIPDAAVAFDFHLDRHQHSLISVVPPVEIREMFLVEQSDTGANKQWTVFNILPD